MKRMKKLMLGVLCLAMSCCFAQAAFADTPIQVIVGGEEVVTNVRPMIVQERVMLPVRAVFEALDATVKYDQATQKITAKRLSTTVEFTIGSNIMKINGEAKEIDVAPMIINNRTLVPLRACSEAFGMEVKWDAKAGIARIMKFVSMLERNHWERREYNAAGQCSYLLAKSLEDYGDKWENLTRPTEYFYEYDEFGNLTQEINRNGAQEYKYVYTNEYDEKNRRIKYTRDEYPTYSPDKSVETIVYTVAYNDYNQPVYAEGTNGYV